MLWECPDCGHLAASDPLASDDWSGEEIPIGPDCPSCEAPMHAIADDGDVCPVCGGSGGGDEGHLRCRYRVDGKVWRNGRKQADEPIAVAVRAQSQGGAVLDLVRELWDASAPEKRCPHVGYHGGKCRCAAVDEGAAEMVCDTASLQLWCLDGERYPKCLFYPQGEGDGS